MEDVLRPRKTEGVLSRDLGDETILYHPGQGSVAVLNTTGALVWSLFDQRHTIREVARRLHETYTVPEGIDPAKDVHELVAHLTELCLLEIHPRRTASHP